jgi:SulP family sulfate permease
MSFSDSVYSGKLAAYLSWGSILTLTGGGILILMISIFGSVSVAVGRPQDEPLPFFILMAQTIALQFPNGEAGFLTVITCIAFTTVITGVLLFFTGLFKYGNFVRFIPFPVIAGFLSGSGLLLMLGSVSKILPGGALNEQFLLQLVHPPLLALWLPTVLFTLSLIYVSERSPYPLSFPIVILISFFLFYLFFIIWGGTLSDLRTAGLLPETHKISLQSLSKEISQLQPVRWDLVHQHLGMMFVIAFISLVALLFITMSLELVLKRDIDFNHELKTAGIANIIAGCFGGLVGYQALGNTVFVSQFKATGRGAGIFCGIVLIISAFYSPVIFGYFPKFILIGLILYLGFSLFYKWSFEIRKSLSFLDKIVVSAVLLITLKYGFINGMIAGFCMAIIFFIITYSRVGIIRYQLNGSELPSSFDSDPVAQKLIAQQSEKILYIKLQGYLFFGSVYSLVKQIKSFEESGNMNMPSYLVYDFEHVSGMDSSAVACFKKIQEFAGDRQLYMLITGTGNLLNPVLASRLSELEFGGNSLYKPNISEAIKFCQSSLLQEMDYDVREKAQYHINLADFLGDKTFESSIPLYFENRVLAAGEYLFHAHETSHEIYFLESGSLSIVFESNNGSSQVISSYGSGSLVGEVAFYRHTDRSASMIAENTCHLKMLDQRNYKKMKIENPELYESFNLAVICLLSEKLVFMTKRNELMK